MPVKGIKMKKLKECKEGSTLYDNNGLMFRFILATRQGMYLVRRIIDIDSYGALYGDCGCDVEGELSLVYHTQLLKSPPTQEISSEVKKIKAGKQILIKELIDLDREVKSKKKELKKIQVEINRNKNIFKKATASMASIMASGDET